MAKTQLQHFINGEYVASKGNDYFDLVSPVTVKFMRNHRMQPRQKLMQLMLLQKKHLKFGDAVHLRLVKKHYLTWQMLLKQMLIV